MMKCPTCGVALTAGDRTLNRCMNQHALNAFTVTVKVPPQMLFDLMTTALEGGVGHWLLVGGDIVRDAQHNVTSVETPLDADTEEAFDRALFAEGFDPELLRLTPDTLFRGIMVLFEPGVLPNRHDLRAGVLAEAGDYENKGGVYLDAGAADVLMQLGTFGELVFS